MSLKDQKKKTKSRKSGFGEGWSAKFFLVIRARAVSEDQTQMANFDATRWFRAAEPGALLRLAADNFRVDDEMGTEILHACTPDNQELSSLASYCQNTTIGRAKRPNEVYIRLEENDVIKWIGENRKDMQEALVNLGVKEAEL